MSKKSKLKKRRLWRVNVDVCYYLEHVRRANYQVPIHSIFHNLSWLHELDVAISIDHRYEIEQGLSDEQHYERFSYDLFYFRSTVQTQISAKAFRELVSAIFRHSGLYVGGVDIEFLLQKDLPKFPFPDTFYRPRLFPFVEVHRGNHISHTIYSDFLLPILAEEQEPSDN